MSEDEFCIQAFEKFNADKLIRQLYVDNTGFVIDATRHATVSGSLTEMGMEILANENIAI